MKKQYKKPKAKTVSLKANKSLLAGSESMLRMPGATLGDSWTDTGKDAWDGSSSSGSGSSLSGGWTDNGDSAWE